MLVPDELVLPAIINTLPLEPVPFPPVVMAVGAAEMLILPPEPWGVANAISVTLPPFVLLVVRLVFMAVSRVRVILPPFTLGPLLMVMLVVESLLPEEPPDEVQLAPATIKIFPPLLLVLMVPAVPLSVMLPLAMMAKSPLTLMVPLRVTLPAVLK